MVISLFQNKRVETSRNMWKTGGNKWENVETSGNKAVINNIFVSRHPTDRSFFSKNPLFFKSGGRKNYWKSNYRNPLFAGM